MAQSKKKYWYTVISKNPARYGGSNVTAAIYTVKRGNIVYVGEVKWQTAAYKGEKHEVYRALHNKKLVSAREYKAASGYWRESTSRVIINQM